jgi:hypothetical protein
VPWGISGKEILELSSVWWVRHFGGVCKLLLVCKRVSSEEEQQLTGGRMTLRESEEYEYENEFKVRGKISKRVDDRVQL